ncbi:MAG: sigma-70 family RNA polymerase sigma factor [Bryobacteraceae bacterium]
MLLPVLFAVIRHGDDRQLAERLKRRDSQAMAELYDRYGRPAYVLILRVVRDSGIAEDLVQETFLRVWNRVQAFDHEKGSLGPWVLTVARNRAIDYLRSVDGRMAHNIFEFDLKEHPSLFRDLETEILNSDRLRRLREAFEKLNPNQRRVVELAYFEGLSQSEMADRLRQPLGTIKTWVRSALKILRDEMQPTMSV